MLNAIKNWFRNLWENRFVAEFPIDYPQDCFDCNETSCNGCLIEIFNNNSELDPFPKNPVQHEMSLREVLYEYEYECEWEGTPHCQDQHLTKLR